MAAVALDAMLLQNRHDVVGEIDCRACRLGALADDAADGQARIADRDAKTNAENA